MTKKSANFQTVSILRQNGATIRENIESDGSYDVVLEKETTTWIDGKEWWVVLTRVDTDRKNNRIVAIYLLKEPTGRVIPQKSYPAISHEGVL